VNTTIDITEICVVYSILQKYTDILKLSQIIFYQLQVKGQSLFLVEVKIQGLFFNLTTLTKATDQSRVTSDVALLVIIKILHTQ